MKKGVIRKVLSYIGKYKYLVFLSVVCAAASALLALYVPILVGKAIDCIVGAGNVDFASMVPYLVQIAVLVCITAILQWLMNVSNNRITFNVVRDMRNRAFSKIQVLPFSYLDSHPHGETVSRVISDAKVMVDSPERAKDMEMLFGVMPICVLTGQLDVMREVLEAESGISSAVKAEAERYLKDE